MLRSLRRPLAFTLAAVVSSVVLGTSCDLSDEPLASSAGAGGAGGVDACPTEPDIDTTPAADPGQPQQAPIRDCGTPDFPIGTTLRRYPYLQSVTQTSARIAWTATGARAGYVRVAPAATGPWTQVEAQAENFDTARTEDTEEYTAFDASVGSLEPNSAYCYEVWTDGVLVASGLKLHTAWEGDSRPLRILAFGDSGNASPDQVAVRDAFMQREFDVFLHLGDMAYGSGRYTEFEEKVFTMYRDFLHGVPSFPTPGNHEYKTNDAEPYLSVYYLFEQALRSEDQERYYSFDYGNVHFVSLDSNGHTIFPIQVDFEAAIDDDMIDWLEDDLAASDAPWKIAFFHHPPFSLYEDRGDNAGVIQHILPALQDGDVDLILVGHDHQYVRSFPIRGECEVPGGEGAIPFIIVGSGGTGLLDIVDEKPGYLAENNDRIHAFLSLTIHGCRGSGEAIDINGDTIDSFEINGCK
jgi:hypothetical protein